MMKPARVHTTSNEYFEVKHFYDDRRAQRSGVPLIYHIDEGIMILQCLNASDETIRAFCLHPLVQADNDLKEYRRVMPYSSYDVILLAMEYRNIANAALSDCVSLDEDGHAYWSGKAIKLSPLKEVNDMLIADKVQNRADFELYHKGRHARSAELDFYFKTWLRALGVDEARYLQLVDLVKGS